MKSAKFLILFFLILFPTISSAGYEYIKITSTTNQNQLWEIKSKLNNLNLSMISRKTQTKYIIYTGPFKSHKSATTALQIVLPTFPNSHIISADKKQLDTDEIQVDSNETNETVETNTTLNKVEQEFLDEEPYNGIFIAVSVSMNYTPYTYSATSGVVIIDTPTEYNIGYEIKGGYKFQNNFLISIGYSRVDSSDLTMDNMILGINYELNANSNMIISLGLLGGQSILQRDTIPLDNSQNKDIQSQSFLAGIELGIVYQQYKIIQPYVSYQYIRMNHEAFIESSTGTSSLKHDTLHNFQVGIRF